MKSSQAANKDEHVVQAFGEEWSRFKQNVLRESDQQPMFEDFFAVFPWSSISATSVGADFGCGSGRWARFVAPRVGHLYLIDAAEAALDVARENLRDMENVSFYCASLEEAPLPDASLDFGYSLGVLHHVPDTGAALRSVVRKLKPGAPLLVYLYYAFDNRPSWFRLLWKLSDLGRRGLSHLPRRLRFLLSDLIALSVYWPLARAAQLLDRLGTLPSAWPLSWYRNRSFYVMRTDALDRFGTRLEQRFSRAQVESMLRDAGLSSVEFSERPPFWCAVAFKR